MAVTNGRNKRSEERVNVVLPVILDDKIGVTRDVSAAGISFEVDAKYALGSEISFVIELEILNEKMLLKCKGHIIRTETHGQKTGVAVKIAESIIEAVK
jgi:hypothetical protein